MHQISFGSVLKEARLAQGRDLASVSRDLRIRQDIIVAIENSDFKRMPSRGYARNMIIAYSRLLGLNSQDVSRMYLDQEYAYQVDIHPAVLAYLEIRRDYFYRMETTVDGRVFATARGWEDLSQLLKTYERLGKKADREVVHQYIQHWKIAKDFANYLELYRKYKKDYGLEKIIEGVYTKDTLERLQYAAFDERLSVVNMLIGRLGTCFKDYFLKDRFVTILYEYLKLLRSNLQIDLVVCEARDKYEKLRKEEQMTKQEDHVRKQVLDTLESYEQLTKEEHLDGEAAFERVKELFGNEVAEREELTEHTLAALEHAFEFMEDAFGDSQEMVSFVTELNTNYYSIQFLRENDCDKYYQYNKKLLFDKQQEEILSEMDEIEQDLNGKC